VRLALLFIVLFPMAAIAADGPLPLNGYYRAGRYMPVRFARGQSELHLTADGVVRTDIADPVGGIAPCFISRTPPPDSAMAQSLRPLQPNEKLIGIAAHGGAIDALFPGSALIQVPLDPVHPLPGPPAAWQALDAVVLDGPAVADLGDERIGVLLAGGTSLLVPARGQSSPESTHSWRLDHGFWFLGAARPVDAEASDEDYGPVSGWNPGRSAHDRAQIMLMAVIWAIVVLLISLSHRRRQGAVWTCVAAVLAIVLIGVWDMRQNPTRQAFGNVHTITEPPVRDLWIFRLATRTCTDSMDFGDFALPILARHGGPEHMTLVCNSEGYPIEFRYDLPADRRAAFVYPAIAGAPPTDFWSRPVTTPLRFLPRSIYPGLEPAGQIASPSNSEIIQWPSLVLARADAMPR
jgi:hypothetical protein